MLIMHPKVWCVLQASVHSLMITYPDPWIRVFCAIVMAMKGLPMKRLSHFLLLLLLVLPIFFITGCKSVPEPEPPELPAAEIPEPTPEPLPEPEPEPEPPRQIELEGPQWILTYLYGTDRIRVPREEVIWISLLRNHDPAFIGTGGTNTLMGSYTLVGQNMNRPDTEPSRTTGALRLSPAARTRMAGPYLPYENHFLEILGLVQGYIVHGTTIEDGRLTFFGGHGREEIVLVEFRSEPGEHWE